MQRRKHNPDDMSWLLIAGVGVLAIYFYVKSSTPAGVSLPGAYGGSPLDLTLQFPGDVGGGGAF